jgi:hypothetical protein
MLPASLTSIGELAFQGCVNLTSVTMPTSLTEIGTNAFNGCEGLTSAEFLGNAPTMGEYVFFEVASGFTVTYHLGATGFTSPTWYGYPSDNIDADPEIEVEYPAGTTLTAGASTTNFGTVPAYASSSLTFTVRNAGTEMLGLALTLTGANASEFTLGAPGSASLNAGNSTTFTVSCTPNASGTRTAVLHIHSNDADENPFDINLTVESKSLFITDNGTSITITGPGFFGISGSLDVPPNLNGKPVTAISNSSFSGIADLTSVNIPASVTSIGAYAFAGCSGLNTITVDGANPNYSSPGGVLFNRLQTTLIQCPGNMAGSYTIPQGVANIGSRTFYGCLGLTSVTIPASVTSIADRAFRGCSGLTSMTIPQNVTSIGAYAFYRCNGLVEFIVGGANLNFSSTNGVLFDKLNTTLIQYPGNKAGSYVIPAGVTSLTASAFNECTKLTSVSIPASVTSIGSEIFTYCSALDAITVDASNPNYSSADGMLFNDAKTTLIQCPGNKSGSCTIPASVTSIGRFAFVACARLTSVSLPPNLSSIAYAAFADCSNLTSVTFPASITSLEAYAFWGCGALTGAEFLSNAPTMGDYVFGSTASSFTVRFHNGTTGFTSPTWLGYPSVNLDGQTYATWQTAKFTPTDIATGQTTMDADFDHDGISNLLERAFGGNPKVSDVTSLAPTCSIAGNNLQISFKCDAACAQLIYTVQVSTTLAPNSWTDIAKSLGGASTTPIDSRSTVADSGSGLRTVTVTDSTPLPATARRFLRVMVTDLTGNPGTTTYATWQSSLFTPSDMASGRTTMAADFDHDGISNLLEYAFGGNPKLADVAEIAPTLNPAGTQLQISFKCDATRADLIYTVQASSALAPDSWTDIATSVGGATTVPIGTLSTVSDTGTGLRTVTVTDSAALPGGGRRFLRVKVTAP